MDSNGYSLARKVIFVPAKDADEAMTVLKSMRAAPKRIGQVVSGTPGVTLV